jgi:hypothetical protein
MKALMFIALMAGLPTAAVAQSLIDGSKTSVSGTVTTTEGVPLQGYPVIIEAPGGGNMVAITGPDGTFRIDGLAPGQYVARPGTLPDGGERFSLDGAGASTTLQPIEVAPGKIQY